ncbi:hypothetical protein HGG64_02400 [Mycoplasma phocoeninasale]|uniref:Lipoprotein n=1 Tax=Mycoplasma phocoeninasale TaxID=2726117 RepID=A0A858U248_9MOLU|nr:hypothetical protein [Mycoplasma phocoeninasale]QJG66540.1 hypothetical protein HGG64_02400 [Mycoplasma phocoeninasale]
MKKKNLKWLAILPVTITVFPLIAASCNFNQVKTDALYLNLYSLTFAEFGKFLKIEDYKSYKFLNEAKKILNQLEKKDSNNKKVLDNARLLLADYENYLNNGREASENDDLIQDIITIPPVKYLDIFSFLDSKNNSISKLPGNSNKFFSELEIFKKYWEFISNSRLLVVNYLYLFYPLNLLENSLQKNIGNKESITEIINFFKAKISAKSSLKLWDINKVSKILKILEIN